MVVKAMTRSIAPDEYLALERKAEYKSEYYHGEVIQMVGASRKHNLIAGNIFASLHRQLRGRTYETYQNDLRVRTTTGVYVYPDVVVVSDTPQFEDAYVDTLLNPTVIVEVLSPSTESFDRGDKFAAYRALDSLVEYLLIAQDRVHVEQYTRLQEGSWRFTEFSTADATIDLPSIGCVFSLAELYEKVDLAQAG